MIKILIILFHLLNLINSFDYRLATSKMNSTNSQDTVKYNFNEKIQEYKSKLDNEFVFIVHSCFLIVSNLTDSESNKIINNTIAPAEKSFYNDFFSIKPNDVITVFLFKNEESYRYWAEKIFNDTDVSLFGYYKPSDRVVLVNISTGSGTLVHEMTHVFLRFDFPDIPVWLNEGLGSLYEQCSIYNSEIKGLVNWRLPLLQKTIMDNSYKPLINLFEISDEEFYGYESNFYYSQARYFCFYMQEKGLLRQFYKNFRDNFDLDYTGKLFVEKVFNDNLENIDTEFKRWVLTLVYK